MGQPQHTQLHGKAGAERVTAAGIGVNWVSAHFLFKMEVKNILCRTLGSL